MLLKDIPGMLPVLENSDLAATKLWQKDIKNIIPIQFTAIILKVSHDNPESKITLEVIYAVQQIRDAVDLGIIENTLLASYAPPQKKTITAFNFIRGLHSMTFDKRRAVLFSLEAKIPLVQVENLTHKQAYRIRPELPDLAREILDSSIASIYQDWVFWEKENGDGKHQKLSNLEAHVTKAFGMKYAELQRRYGNIIYEELTNVFEAST